MRRSAQDDDFVGVSLHVNLWKKHLGYMPASIWENLEMETLVLAENDLTALQTCHGCASFTCATIGLFLCLSPFGSSHSFVR